MRERFGAERGYCVTGSDVPCSTSMGSATSLKLADEGSPCSCLLFLAFVLPIIFWERFDVNGIFPSTSRPRVCAQKHDALGQQPTRRQLQVLG